MLRSHTTLYRLRPTTHPLPIILYSLHCLSMRHLLFYSDTGNLNLSLSHQAFLIPSNMGTPTVDTNIPSAYALLHTSHILNSTSYTLLLQHDHKLGIWNTLVGLAQKLSRYNWHPWTKETQKMITSPLRATFIDLTVPRSPPHHLS